MTNNSCCALFFSYCVRAGVLLVSGWVERQFPLEYLLYCHVPGTFIFLYAAVLLRLSMDISYDIWGVLCDFHPCLV